MSSQIESVKPEISIIIGTHNRSPFLRKCLEGLRSQDIPATAFEVIVVDNASTDDTPQLVESWKGKGIWVRYAMEDRLGLSNARNRGIGESQGEFVAFIDDDAVPVAGWVRSLLEVHRSYQADAVGGRILQEWPVSPPEWLPDELNVLLTCLDLGDEVIPMGDDKFPFGANMSFRKDILTRLGGFNPMLGWKAGQYTYSSEELDLCRRIQSRGGSIYYAPDAIVYHYVHPERLNQKHFRYRFYWQGRSDAVLRGKVGADGMILSKLTDALTRWFITRRSSPKEALLTSCWLGYRWGFYLEAARAGHLGRPARPEDAMVSKGQATRFLASYMKWLGKTTVRQSLRRMRSMIRGIVSKKS